MRFEAPKITNTGELQSSFKCTWASDSLYSFSCSDLSRPRFRNMNLPYLSHDTEEACLNGYNGATKLEPEQLSTLIEMSKFTVSLRLLGV